MILPTISFLVRRSKKRKDLIKRGHISRSKIIGIELLSTLKAESGISQFGIEILTRREREVELARRALEFGSLLRLSKALHLNVAL